MQVKAKPESGDDSSQHDEIVRSLSDRPMEQQPMEQKQLQGEQAVQQGQQAVQVTLTWSQSTSTWQLGDDGHRWSKEHASGTSREPTESECPTWSMAKTRLAVSPLIGSA